MLISNNVCVGLVDHEPRLADSYDCNNFVWIDSCPRTGNSGLAERGEHCPLAEVIRGGRAVREKIGREEDPIQGDERAGIAGNCVIGVELMNYSVSDVLDLTAQLVTQPNVIKRTCRDDIRKRSVRGRVRYR